MIESYKLYWKNYFNFSGRTPRCGYWWPVLCSIIIYLVLCIIAFALRGNPISSWDGDAGASNLYEAGNIFETRYALSADFKALLIIWTLFEFANIIPGISVAVRRLHDTGRRWYWILLPYVPLAILFISALIAAASGSDASGATVNAITVICSIAMIGCSIAFIIFMCMATGPNAIGVSTHGEDSIAQTDATNSGDVPNAAIIGMSGMYADVVFPLQPFEEVVIGRDAAFSHIVISGGSEKVSRMHVSISYSPQESMYFVTDLSTNGTYLNDGRRLPPRMAERLLPGSMIYLAKPDNSFRLA